VVNRHREAARAVPGHVAQFSAADLVIQPISVRLGYRIHADRAGLSLQIAVPLALKTHARAAITACVGRAFAVLHCQLVGLGVAARVASRIHACADLEFTPKLRKSWRGRRRRPPPMRKVYGKTFANFRRPSLILIAN